MGNISDNSDFVIPYNNDDAQCNTNGISTKHKIAKIIGFKMAVAKLAVTHRCHRDKKD